MTMARGTILWKCDNPVVLIVHPSTAQCGGKFSTCREQTGKLETCRHKPPNPRVLAIAATRRLRYESRVLAEAATRILSCESAAGSLRPDRQRRQRATEIGKLDGFDQVEVETGGLGLLMIFVTAVARERDNVG